MNDAVALFTAGVREIYGREPTAGELNNIAPDGRRKVVLKEKDLGDERLQGLEEERLKKLAYFAEEGKRLQAVEEFRRLYVSMHGVEPTAAELAEFERFRER